MANGEVFPSQEELQAVPIRSLEEVVKYYTEEHPELADRGEAGPFRCLMTAPDFLEALRVLGGFRVTQRMLGTYVSWLRLIPPPVPKDGQGEYYVYPEHLDLALLVLALRQVHFLPLRTIRELLERVSADMRHLLTAGKLSTDDLLDLAKMLPKGCEIKDLVMAKACDVMLEDVLPSGRALTAATEPGGALESLEEKLILGRLEQIREWVRSGRRADFVRQEAAQDLEDLAWRKRIAGKIRIKMMARQNRVFREKIARLG